jgi:hypothetical protein
MLQACRKYFKERYGIGFCAEAITWVFLANEKMILLLASFGFVGVVNCLIRNCEL